MLQPVLLLQVEPPVASNKSVSDAISLGVWHRHCWGRTNTMSIMRSSRNAVPFESAFTNFESTILNPRFACMDKVIHQFPQ